MNPLAKQLRERAEGRASGGNLALVPISLLIEAADELDDHDAVIRDIAKRVSNAAHAVERILE